MVLRLRVSLPDRPGVLGAVTTRLGELGADVHQVSVMTRETGRAWDDITLGWPDRRPVSELIEAVESLPGVVLDGVWPTRDVPGSFPELDLLGHVASGSGAELQTTVDALPGVVSAAWAVALTATTGAPTIGCGSVGAPADIADPALQAAVAKGRPPRALALTADDGTHLALLPTTARGPDGDADTVIVVVRPQGAPFHPLELERLARLLECVAALTADRDRVAAPTAGRDQGMVRSRMV